ncbi:fumarylacetoacetase [Actinoplanes sp. NBRC 14428]|uniref:fumarylacetoacetase n=1 Tax=Pseudosporangium ferrugineum TaxID=439699 RepID=A0A2T0S5Z4_9ACTN|nr:fumarylacetoacetase [Pseudosporangium ferrugineum]PRY28848.1 fumarylacetoacetate hydrolase [Pseudosporangium ferrugineum]BCJ53692.1 fumarylacetoacetase [Actinoplanes sp. NBRC 14428]
MTLFGPETLPYGVFSTPGGARRIGVRLGDAVLDLARAEADDLILAGGALRQPSLNVLMALGRPQWTAIRARVAELAPDLPAIPLADVELHLPFEVADYTDFYSSEHHATNVGRILRPDRPGLQPNWKHLPIGYHGRAATVVVSGTPIARPAGQLGPGEYGPSRRLDIEAEVGFVVGVPGRRLRTADLAEHVFGVVLVNDWSARDIQAYEYQPLGPFLGKSFATSVSPWVVPLEAFAPVEPPAQDPAPHDYLLPPGPALDIRLRVEWNGTEVSSPPYAQMYWTPAQQLAHLTSNGALVRTGDLFASGTVSGPERSQAGSFLELTWNGAEPVRLADGTTRGFLLDGDTVTISATAAGAGGTTIGLGSVTGTVCP